tara:strand:- start:168 stop:590 length:423 start_codon:yes stop_codon:yes gene_type:complete
MIKESADFLAFLENFDSNPFHEYLGLKVAEHRDDFARLRLTVGSDTPTGIGGSVNGGVIATMIDMSSIVAVFAGIPDDTTPAGTADLNVTYLRQAHGDWVDALATVVKRGRQLCTIEVRVMTSEEVLCAIGRVLYSVRSG